MAKKDCPPCKGTGICANCNGEGQIGMLLGRRRCGVCEGSGKCQRCNGKGVVPED